MYKSELASCILCKKKPINLITLSLPHRCFCILNYESNDNNLGRFKLKALESNKSNCKIYD